jgi:A/G-specific adenine glycosylase
VLKLWQGLGYYSRARNLHHTAKEVVSRFGGVFPASYEELRSLKGIGDYTASAIASIAFGLPYAVLDGNVFRVLARLYGIDLPINLPAARPIFAAKAAELLDKQQPGAFNEAMMEFGATQCIPKNPPCSVCPLRECCTAFATGMVNDLPRKDKKAPQKNRYLHYLLILRDGGLYLRQRSGIGIWEGLYDLPSIEKETEGLLSPAEVKEAFGVLPETLVPRKNMLHQLTHQRLNISFYETLLPENVLMSRDGVIFVPISRLKEFPLPKPIELFLAERLNNPGIW